MEFLQQLGDSSIYAWVILPILIFISRICDVSIGTIRIIFVSRGKKLIAPILGFFEVSIWLLAMSQIMQNLDNAVCFIAYAGGFATGNYIGILIEEKLAMGTLIVRIFLVNDNTNMRERLYEAGFGVTTIDAHGGTNGEVKIIYSVIKRKALSEVVEIIEACESNAFYSVEEVKSVRKGFFPFEDKPSMYIRKSISRRRYSKKAK